MSALTNNNRVRHSKTINALLNLDAENMTTGIIHSPVRSWPWGKLGKRLGTFRSADGVVLDLPDAIAPDGKKVVAKFIFTTSFKQMQAAEREYKLGRMMASAGIGAKPYAIYELYQKDGPNGSFVNYGQVVKNKLGSGGNSLFSYDQNLSDFGNAYIIIMENLYKGPGLVGAYTVKDAMAANLPIPYRQLKKAVNRMHRFGIIHGDLHYGNVMIQYIKKPYRLATTRVVIIDFGRSVLANRPLVSIKNANEVAKAGRTRGTGNQSQWYYNPNGNSILLNGNAMKYYNRFKPKLPAFLRRKA
jgi:serine/threonine protein kinase